MAKQENRIVQLDGLRGIAVLLVISFHFLNNQYAQVYQADNTKLNFIEKALMKATYFGWCGVDLFFVLSGFLIGSILLRVRGSENYFKTFYLRRFFRIIPIYYLLLILFLLLRVSPLFTADAYIFEKPLPMWGYFLFFQNFYMGAHGHFGPEALTPTWSLAVEEQFYIIVPLIVYLAKPRYLAYVCLFFILLAPVGRYLSDNWYQRYTLLTSRIDSPTFGLLLAYLLYNEKSSNFIRTHMRTIRIVGIPFLLVSSVIYGASLAGVFNHTILAINFSLIILILIHLDKGLLYKALTSRFLVYTGGLSYFLYLYHQVINGVFHLAFLHEKVPLLAGKMEYLVTGAALAVVFGLATLSFKYFEQPLIRFSHSFKY